MMFKYEELFSDYYKQHYEGFTRSVVNVVNARIQELEATVERDSATIAKLEEACALQAQHVASLRSALKGLLDCAEFVDRVDSFKDRYPDMAHSQLITAMEKARAAIALHSKQQGAKE